MARITPMALKENNPHWVELQKTLNSRGLAEHVRDNRNNLVRLALAASGGNVSVAAYYLKVNRTTLAMYLKAHPELRKPEDQLQVP